LHFNLERAVRKYYFFLVLREDLVVMTPAISLVEASFSNSLKKIPKFAHEAFFK